MGITDNNFEDLVSNWPLFKDRMVVFLGAGASMGAKNLRGERLLNAYELRNALWEKFKHNPTSGLFNPEELRLMTLEHAAAIIEAKTGRVALSEYLVDAFSCDRPLWQHIALSFLSPRSMFTTNYDELVELGYRVRGGTILDVIPNDRDAYPNRTALYKPHGSLTHANQPVGKGGLVITQFDYLEMITEYRQMLQRSMTGFGNTCVIVIGYSFGDMDIGAELYSLRQQSKGIPWYAVFPRSDPQVRKMYSNRFGIEQIDATFEQFMQELDTRVSFIPEQYKYPGRTTLISTDIIQA
ncbi:MAG TPA: SIR2 family protein [Rhizomicrobium sp.]